MSAGTANGGRDERKEAAETGYQRRYPHIARRRDEEGKATMIDAYMAGKMAEYTQAEIARTRGVRTWTHLFKSTRLNKTR